jgi:hypothetical protein
MVLGHHAVQYYRCKGCGFVQTEEPYWLDEAYSEAITASDIGIATRNLWMARVTQAVILAFFNSRGKFLDYGGGPGLLVRLMRDAAFDFYRADKYSPNLFARGFEVEAVGRQQYELLTAFEVFEHLVQPYEEVAAMLQYAPSIFFSTLLLPTPTPALDRWWYYGPEHGQHVGLYSHRSLEALAARLGVNFYTNGRSLHLLTTKQISPRLFRLVANYGSAALASPVALPRRLFLRQTLPRDEYVHLIGPPRK